MTTFDRVQCEYCPNTTATPFGMVGHILWIHTLLTVEEWGRRCMIVIPPGVSEADRNRKMTSVEFMKGVR